LDEVEVDQNMLPSTN